jgi:hypothetical protein
MPSGGDLMIAYSDRTQQETTERAPAPRRISICLPPFWFGARSHFEVVDKFGVMCILKQRKPWPTFRSPRLRNWREYRFTSFDYRFNFAGADLGCRPQFRRAIGVVRGR